MKPDSTSDVQPILEVRNLRKSFGTLEVLKDVNVSACKGDILTLIGSSGSGKSTLIRCINFLEEPSHGEIVLDGAVFPAIPSWRRTRKQNADLIMLRRKVGMVFQSFNLWPHRSAIENVMEGPLQVLGLSKKEAHERARAYLDKVGLGDRNGHYPAQLSGGQQQRVAIARALAMEPEILLFDEPTSALDPELVGEVLRVMQNLAVEGRTMVIVTHEMHFAREVSSEVIYLLGGTIKERGKPNDVLGNPKSEALASFLQRYRQ
ncbi:histidine/lysine/arginine/ornithine ABC transporter ATP-binding protein [Mesorhizobium erdmanii]|uniref:Histidine/lysine/arginine/ornithine ABC transporter ATP-binding protein n=2 Tax=Mesorhizobium TaxID=68287 RepID=A0A3M9X4C5_9HYPH|nr:MULTISPECIES: amino acid ABC transporter ATP-binding protein [Mesorhizobium]RNJ42783.1 histidine/lysine/arginine/ornithine ABC transporter ATP-binding protein [Mesorhizobium japonicum]RXT42649.1 histidine/lysine/arginine/ornithine ABC transporter ATP-binding protein [Mesorhizobium erdmanii]